MILYFLYVTKQGLSTDLQCTSSCPRSYWMPPKGMPGCLPPSCGLCAFCYKKKYKDLLGLVAFAFFSIDNTDQKNDQYWKERATRIKEKEICLAYSPKRKYRNPRYNIVLIKFTYSYMATKIWRNLQTFLDTTNSFMGSKPPEYLVILFLTKFLFWFFCETSSFLRRGFILKSHNFH